MLSITLLGTGAACPTVDRNVTAISLHREGESFLFDCGEGTQRQIMRYGTGFSFQEVFFTHFHGDHILGITGLLRTMSLLDRTEPVVLYGPPHSKRILGGLLNVGVDRAKFPVEIIELTPGTRLGRKEYDIWAFEADHRQGSLGYALVEHDRLGRFDPERARAMGIPEGPLWGKIHRGEVIQLADGKTVGPEALVGPARPGRTVVLTGDTRPSPATVAAARGADLLIHDATFGEEDASRAHETGHSTARQAAQVAWDAGVKKLVLTHISARYTREAPELLAEARAVFPNTLVARDGMVVEIPFVGEAEGSGDGAAGGDSGECHSG